MLKFGKAVAAVSLIAIVGSVPAFAQTTQTIIAEPSRQWEEGWDPVVHMGTHFFEFTDNRINPSGSPFVTIKSEPWYMEGNYLYTHHILTIRLDNKSPYAFDSTTTWNNSGVGIFDFKQSYVDGPGSKQTLAEVLASSTLISAELNTWSNTFTIEWGCDGYFSSRPDITYTIYNAAIAYNLPVPEPETWAMLLAGLSIVGTIARRRKVNVN
ncbi:MAG: PEPxxWA-CTERM sorting domain-containing protein [Betaproteobacteria bacterium]|nr:PEPxxWA-CTERM sorting domain-containing protein [Betaproteobacteria bacterium]